MSYWQELHPPVSTATAPVRDHYDTGIIGAGLVGLASAVQLAELEQSVVVLEARDIGVGTTGGSTAKVSLLQGERLSQIAAKHSQEALEQYVAGNRFGQD